VLWRSKLVVIAYEEGRKLHWVGYGDFGSENYDFFVSNRRKFSGFWPSKPAYDQFINNRHKSMTLLSMVIMRRS
jgi:hypothetical protein